MPSTRYRTLLQTAAIYLALVSFGFAQPLFNVVTLFRREFHLGLSDVFLVVLVYQFGVTVVLLMVRRLLGRWYRGLDYLLYTITTISIIRQVQQTYLGTEGLSLAMKLGLAGVMIGCAILLVVFFRRHLDFVTGAAGYLSPLFGIFFIYQIASGPLPLVGDTPQSKPDSTGPPIVVAIFDELSLPLLLDENGDIDQGLFPNFHRLSRMGVWYREAISNHPGSSMSFPSFLSGRYLLEDMQAPVDNLEKLPAKSLPWLLRQVGYEVVVYTDFFGCAGEVFRCRRYLSGDEPAFLWRAFTKFIQEFGPDFLVDRYLPWFTAGMLWNQLDFLAAVGRSADTGMFFLVHLMSSHAPYVLDANGKHHFRRGLRMAPGTDFRQSLENYRQQLRFTDRELGRFLDVIEESGLIDKGVILVTSDHGNCWSLDCPGRVYPSKIRVIEPTLPRIPAFLIAPGVPHRIDDGGFQLVDLLPTTLEAAGMPAPTGIDGRSALRAVPAGHRRLFYLKINQEPHEIGVPAKAVAAARLD